MNNPSGMVALDECYALVKDTFKWVAPACMGISCYISILYKEKILNWPEGIVAFNSGIFFAFIVRFGYKSDMIEVLCSMAGFMGSIVMVYVYKNGNNIVGSIIDKIAKKKTDEFNNNQK